MLVQLYLLSTRLCFSVLLCSTVIYAPNGMEENSSHTISSSAITEPLPQTSSASQSSTTESSTVSESQQSEHDEFTNSEQAVTTKEISTTITTSELEQIVTPTVAPATPHYDTESPPSSPIVNSIVHKTQEPEKTVEEPKEQDSKNVVGVENVAPDQTKEASEPVGVHENDGESNRNAGKQGKVVVTEGVRLKMDTPPSEDTDSITATLKQAEEESSPKEEEMPSFDEFKKKLLEEEQSKIKQQQQQQQQQQENTQTPHQPPLKPKVKKLKERKKNNYAAVDCGAKILGSNPEASSALSILMENRDLYMLNPCSEQIWFIVELCELVQVKTIEIANFELFSSTPESFRVYVSSRYPTREWTMLGTFQARDERDVQSFPLDEPIYAKYLKVEMLSHFGSQHYCPLSLFRVFGVSMVEEYEDHESDSHDSDSTDSEDEEVVPVLSPDPGVTVEKEDKKPNILEEAANTVLNFVKEAAKKITQVVNKSNETSRKNEEKGLGKESQDKNKQSIVTLIGKEEMEDGAVMLETENQTVNNSVQQLGQIQTPLVNNKDPSKAPKETVFAAHQRESETLCSTLSPYERLLHILGSQSSSRCLAGRKLLKLASITNAQKTKVTLQQEFTRKSPVVSKMDQEDEDGTRKVKIEKKIEGKTTTMDKASSSVPDSVEEQSFPSSVSSSSEVVRDTNSTNSPSLQNQEPKQTDTKQKPVANQTLEKILITTFIQPSQAKETFSKRPDIITLQGSKTPHLSSVVAVTVKPGNSTFPTTSSSSAETAETAAVENDNKPVNTPQQPAITSSMQENIEEQKIESKSTEQHSKKPAVDDKTPSVADVKPKNDLSQDSVAGDASKPTEPATESKETGCEAQTDAVAMLSSSVSQCSAVNSIEMMKHPIPGVDVLEIKLTDGDKEATAQPQQPENGIQKDASLETEQNTLSKEDSNSEGSAKVNAKLGEFTVDKDSELASGSLDSAKISTSEVLPSAGSAADKLVLNQDESVPPIAAPPVVATKDVLSSPASSTASAAIPSSVKATAVNDEWSTPSNTDGGTSAEVPPATDTSFDAHYTSSIDKMAAQVGSTSAPNLGTGSGGTQKESIFLRLSNKIKALEQNLTLSTRYMEQLNQRYRKSLEEIQKKFDKRVTVLANATKLAEALINSQKEQITKLQGKQREMESTVVKMVEKMHLLNQEVMERHIVGLFLEIVLIVVVLAILRRRDRARLASLAQSARESMVMNGHGPPRSTATLARCGNKTSAIKQAAESAVGEDYPSTPLLPTLENIGPALTVGDRHADKHKGETHDSLSEAAKKKKSRRKSKSSSVSSVSSADLRTNSCGGFEKSPPSNPASLVSQTAGLLFSPIGFLNGLRSKKPPATSNSDPCIGSGPQVTALYHGTNHAELPASRHTLVKSKSLQIVPEDNSSVFIPLTKKSKIPCPPPSPPTNSRRSSAPTQSPKKIPSSPLHSLPTKSRGKIRGMGHCNFVTG